MYVGNMGACNSIQNTGFFANTGVTKLPSAAQDNSWDTPTVSGAAMADYCSVARKTSANDSLSQIRTDECVAGEIQGKLQNLSELAECSANDNCTDEERAGLQAEAEEIKTDINRIACYSSRAMFAATPTVGDGAGAAGGAADKAVLTDNQKWDEDGETQVATWSATIDPLTVNEGTAIRFKDEDGNALFEIVFTDDTNIVESDKLIKINPTDTTNIATNLTNRVNDADTAKKIGQALGWKRNLNPNLTDEQEAEAPVKCTWAADGTLTFTQSEAWAHDGNKFSIEVESKRLTDVEQSQSNVLGSIPTDEIKTGDILTVDGLEFRLNLGSVQTPSFTWNDGKDKAEIYISKLAGSGSGSLSAVLVAALKDKDSTKYGSTKVAAMEDGTNSLNIIIYDANDPSHKYKLGIEASVPKLESESSSNADIKTPAYLEYGVDFRNIDDGDSFKFKGVRFVFDTNGDTSDSPYVNSGQEKVVHVGIKDRTPEDSMTIFRDTFNSWFKEDTRGGSKSGSGAARSGGIQAFKNIFRFVKAGAFEMRVDNNGNVATVAIYAKTKDALSDEKIELEKDEGWYNADGTPVEDTGDAEGTAGDGASEGDEIATASVEEVTEMEEFETKARALDAGGEANAAEAAAASLGIETVDISTQEGAKEAESTIASAARKVTTLRSTLEDEESKMKTISNDPLVNADTISDVEKAKEAVKNTAEKIVEESEDSGQAHTNIESGVVAGLVAS